MMNTQSKTSNFNGSKTSRSCDICLHRCAAWFCAADDAFLCQSCDTSVHSANQLASRHERVRLEITTSRKIKEYFIKKEDEKNSCLVWHQGFTKKPRTPRIHKSKKRLGNYSNVAVLVPEISTTTYDDQEIFPSENEEQLLYRVPVLDPFEMDDIILSTKDTDFVDLDLLLNNDHEEVQVLEEELCGFEELCQLGFKSEVCLDKGMKFEEDEVTDLYYDPRLVETTSESFNWDFDYSSSPIGEVEEEELLKSEVKMKVKQKRGRINLKLNHEAIICAWDCKTSPWMNGIRPHDFNLDDCWSDFMEAAGCTFDENIPNGGNSGRCGGRRDEEREARVLRYKEKRRTRLFAKKIRYEVRKLNAEKRPRMKGRFVKRTASSSLPCYLMNKQ